MTCTDFPKDNLVVDVTTHLVGNVTYLYKGGAPDAPRWEAITPPLDLDWLNTIYRRAATVAQIENGDFAVGSLLSVSDFDDAPFNVISGSNPDGYETLDAGAGKVAIRATIQNFSKMNNIGIHEFSRRIRMRETTNVNWYGDSNSVRDSNGLQNAFKASFFKPYGNQFIVDVLSRATSGFTAKDCYETFNTQSNAKLGVIVLGTNDAIYDGDATASLESYEKYMRLLIEREVTWGNGVVIVTPPPTRYDKQHETYTQLAPTDPFPQHRPDVAVYEGVAKKLAHEYGCPVFDSREFLSQYSDARYADASASIGSGVPFGDPIHIFTPFTEAWGRSIAARCMCDNLIRPYTARAGASVQIRPAEDPYITSYGYSAVNQYEYTTDNSQHFASGGSFNPYRALRVGTGECVCYAFYVDSPTIIYPAFTAKNGCNFNISLLLTTSAKATKQVDDSAELSTEYGSNGNTNFSTTVAADTVYTKDINPQIAFRILTAGWVYIIAESNAGDFLWSGLQFGSVENIETNEKVSSNTSLIRKLDLNIEADGFDFDTVDYTSSIWCSTPSSVPEAGVSGWYVTTTSRLDIGTLRIQEWRTTSGVATNYYYIRQFAGGSWGAFVTV